MKTKSIKNYKNIFGKKVLLRAGFNVPVKNNRVLDDYRIMRGLDTVKYLIKNDCQVVIVTHLGRPDPEVKEGNLSIKPVAKKLAEILDKEIQVVDDFKSLNGGTIVSKMKNRDIVMLENIRYEEGELRNSKKLAKDLSRMADIYVNDAFSVSHRNQMSVSAIKAYLPSFAGILLEQEVLNLNKVIKPIEPLVVMLGGAKIKTKLPLIKNLEKKADKILIGGAMANNFFVSQGFNVGKSMIDNESIEFVKSVNKEKLLLPVDVVVSADKTGHNIRVKKINEVSSGDYIFDIGPATVNLFSKTLQRAKTIIWNGPMGFFELSSFRRGTISLAQKIATKSGNGVFSVVGGGETVEVLKIIKMENNIDWVSTGGGAMLSYLGRQEMPGLKKLLK